jgi:hypothetical protein
MRHRKSICAFNITHCDGYSLDGTTLNVQEQLDMYGKVPGSKFLECS